MKMAKADQDDIDKTIAFFQLVEEFMEYGKHTTWTDDDEEQSVELDDVAFVEKLRSMWGGRFRPNGVDCAWMRVVFGYQVLVDNACDPNASTLEWKPELAKLLEAAEGATP
jgi:hypothetical protein